MNIPKELKIGPYTYTVRLVTRKEAPEVSGDCDYDGLTIRVVRHLKRDKKADVLLHEVLHAIHHLKNAQDVLKTDEQWIEATVPGLLQVIRENPKLISYLEEKKL